MAHVETRYDVAVLGRGPAGAVVAYLLASWGLGVALIERAGSPIPAKYLEILAPGAYPVVSALELFERFTGDPTLAVPCRGVHTVWGAAVQSARAQAGGFVVERQRFDACLAERAAAAGAKRLAVASGLPAPRRIASWWRIAALGADPGALAARVLVDATGRTASFARRLGARRRVHDRLLAMGFDCDPGSGDWRAEAAVGPEWLRVEAVEDGWWYALAGPDGRRQAVFVTDRLAIGRTCAASAPAIARRLGATASVGPWLGYQHGGAPTVASPRMADASSACLDPINGDGWLAVGDAATSFDPITSQGLPQALGAALVAAHAIREYLAGQEQALAVYAEAARQTWLRSTIGRAAIYAGETRWPNSPFWMRRLARACPVQA